NGGGIWGKSNFNWEINPPSNVFSPTNVVDNANASLKNSSFIGGGQVGANYQFNNYVLGLEGDFDYAKFNAHRNVTAIITPTVSINVNEHASTDWLSTVRARIGYASNAWFLYGTGGLAIAKVHYSDELRFIQTNPSIYSEASNKTETGWTAGGGLEWRFATNWSAKAEYLYVDLGSKAYTTYRQRVLTGIVEPQGFINHNHNLTASVARLGVNYLWS
ncbi:MAG: porin family protein, partial [Legionella sp.]